MSWIKRNNATISTIKPLNNNNAQNNKPYLKDFDLRACYDSFKKHWQQIFEIICKYDLSTEVDPKHDDVLTVVNHLNQILNLIQVELRSDCIVNSCIEYLLSENYLECLCIWTVNAQRYNNSLRVEQLRIYEVLLSNLHNKILNRDAFLKPLIKLLNSFNGDCLPVDIEKKLVILLNQLCSLFSQQTELLNSLLPSNCDAEQNEFRFDIFSLLVQFVHRDGIIGEQARDSLLLCMSLSKNNARIADYVTSQPNICPVLAAGLNGLYSLLPRKLNVESPDWFRFAADDVYEMKELTNFMNSLEFCNVVIQVCHPSIKAQLYDYIYQGFLVPVMGPALVQSTEEELIATTAYFELLIRSVTHPGLLHAFIKFLLKVEVDGQRVIDSLIQRLNHNSKLSVVTLALLETLIDLNCEDIMLDLVLKHLIPCTHIMFSQRSRIQRVDPYCRSAEKFFSLMLNIPRCNDNLDSSVSDYHIYLRHARSKILSCSKATVNWTYPYDGENPPQIGFVKHEDYVKPNCDSELEPNSLPSADDGSSGYESFKAFRDNDRILIDESVLDDRRTNPPSPCGSETTLEYCSDFSKQIFNKPQLSQSPKKQSSNDVFSTTPCIGPLLSIIFQKIEDLLNCDFYIILRLTGIISRLAIYTQPLLYSFLLDDTLVFQPCIKSLFQVLGLLKQKIESRLSKLNDLSSLVTEAEIFLNERIENLNNSKKRPNSESVASLPNTSPNEPFSRGDGKRKSFSVAIGAMFRRNSNLEHVEAVGNGCYRYIKGNNAEMKHTILCSIIVNEWLKELAAISQEHTRFKTYCELYIEPS
ncbi:FHIP family protein AGAP011705 isoform X2 [Planococcus citri]|uniref:FHIP family protein AGAP011705 isoform X2 n=1 Tax=Planococcus citri TaxID=170843 RepID=UPI0031F82628